MANSSTTVGEAVEEVNNRIEEKGQEVATNPLIERLTRFGYAMRGFLYILIGVLAAGVATGRGNGEPDQTGAIAALGSHRLGQFLLVLMAIGLAGYSLWGFIRAFLDPLGKGAGPKGLVQRIGYIVSGLTYGSLVIPTIITLRGGDANGDDQAAQDWTAQLLATEFGPWLVGVAGTIAMAGGLGQMYLGYRAGFVEELKVEKMSLSQLKLVRRIGRFGMWARGIVFIFGGLFLVRAALEHDPSEVKGLDGALMELQQQRLGPWVLLLVALGLAAFGLFSLLSARYVRVCEPSDETCLAPAPSADLAASTTTRSPNRK